MIDRIRQRRPLRTGVRRALLHFSKAGYEVVSGLAALVEELVSSVRDDTDEPGEGPQHIDVE